MHKADTIKDDEGEGAKETHPLVVETLDPFCRNSQPFLEN